MAVDYTYTPGRTYRDYLASHHVKENIDVVLSKPIRQAVGSVEDIFKRSGDGLAGALKDLIWFRAGANENIEVVRVNLWDVCGARDPCSIDTVAGFQALFVKADEHGPSLAHLGSVGGAASDQAGEIPDPHATALSLIDRQLYPQALQVLQQPRAGRDRDWRCDYLVGVLLAGVPGQPRSAEVVDLEAAEKAFVEAAQRAKAIDPSAAAQAYVGAGKAAYAANRMPDAARHFGAALELDPSCGEAHYQFARLHALAKNASGVRRHLPCTFDCHWSYGVRAASDPLLAADHTLVSRCLNAGTRAMVREARTGCSDTSSRLRFLKAQDRFYPLADNPAFMTLAAEVTHMEGAMWADVLKRAFDMRKKTRAMLVSVNRLAKDYCAVLLANEEAIVHRDCRYRRRRDPAALAHKIGGWVLPWAHATVPALLCAAGYLAATSPEPWWSVPLSSISFVIGSIAFRRQWYASHLIDERVCRGIEAALAARQRLAIWWELRRNATRAARNRRLLQQRLQRIEQRFGFAVERPVPAQTLVLADEPVMQAAASAESPMVPAQ